MDAHLLLQLGQLNTASSPPLAVFDLPKRLSSKYNKRSSFTHEMYKDQRRNQNLF